MLPCTLYFLNTSFKFSFTDNTVMPILLLPRSLTVMASFSLPNVLNTMWWSLLASYFSDMCCHEYKYLIVVIWRIFFFINCSQTPIFLMVCCLVLKIKLQFKDCCFAGLLLLLFLLFLFFLPLITEIPTSLDSCATNTPSVKMLCPQTKLLVLILS